MVWRTKHDSIRHETTGIDGVVTLVDVGGGTPGLPAVDASLLLNLPPSPGATPLKDEDSDETESSTTSTTYQQKLRLSVNITVAGKYCINWSIEATQSSPRSAGLIKVELDDTTIISEVQVIGEASDAWSPISGFYYTNLSIGTHTIDVDYRRNGTTGTVYIRRTRLAVEYA